MTITERRTDGAVPVAEAAGETESRWMRRLPWISGPIMLLALIGAWQLAVSVVGVSAFILPAPAAVAGALGELLASDDIWGHIGVTLLEVLAGFAIALLVGVA